MPIRGFDNYLVSKYSRKLPLKAIDNTDVAIDGFWFIKKYILMKGKSSLEDNVLAIKTGLQPLIDKLKSTNIIWIWDGIDYVSSTYYINLQKERDYSLNSKSNFDIMSGHGSVNSKKIFDVEFFVEPITQFLTDAGVTVIRAPYSAIAQCVYFLEKKIAKYIFTKTDALYFEGGNELIVDIILRENINSISVIDRNFFFEDFGFNLYGFRVFAFMCGCELCYTVPKFATDFNIEGIWKLLPSIEDIDKYLKDSFNSRKTENMKYEESQEYKWLTLFKSSFICVKHHPVMGENGEIELLNNNNVPEDIDKVFGACFPSFIYHELFKCNLSPILLNKLGKKEEFYNKHMNRHIIALKKLLDKNYVIDKSKPASDVLAKLYDLKIVYVDNIEKINQFLFLMMFNSGISKDDLFMFLHNIGIKENTTLWNIEFIIEKINTYLLILNSFICFKDIHKLIITLYKLQNDFKTDLSFHDIFKAYKKSHIINFLRKNNIKDNAFTQLLADID